MEFRQIEVFCAIVEWGNFSEAAKHLYITQPTASNHISKLEKALNTCLFERTTKSLTLTDDGKRFYEYAQSLLRLRDKTMLTFTREDKNHLHVGASSIPSAYILPELLSAYHQQEPESSFSILSSDSRAILEHLQDGSLDIGFSGIALNDERFLCHPIYNDEMIIVTPASAHYKQLKEENAPVERILQEPFISRETGSGTKKAAQQFMTAINFDVSSLNVVAQMNDLEAVKQAIAHGLGVSILSRMVVKDLLRTKKILCFPLNSNSIYRQYYMIHHKKQPMSQPLARFIKFVLQASF